MKYIAPLLFSFVVVGCNSGSTSSATYTSRLEKENNISYDTIINTRGAYITSMCYTKTKDEKKQNISNPCYSCHTKGKIPNYFNDTKLQKDYFFPKEMLQNPFKNLFKERSAEVDKISDSEILTYIRRSNYFTKEGEIRLAKELPLSWQGYRPDCYYVFDKEGFDHRPNGDYTLWRAFRYYPFLGTFWPTNGSTDDVLIRLDKIFTQNEKGEFSKEIYALNLSIVEAIVKQKDIAIAPVDETLYGVDLNHNEKLDQADFISKEVQSYIGKAKGARLSKGLFPLNTEFLHSVRYIDWSDENSTISMSKRMKELRYAKKTQWLNYSQIKRVASKELWEAQANETTQGVMATFRGDYEHGLKNELGWVYQGFIEAKNGALRPQTHEETIGCMGCHSHLGATTDSIFSFARKFEGIDKSQIDFGWNHWSQKGLKGIKEPKVSYLGHGEQYEYSFYLQNNHSGNEFRDNNEVEAKFFDANGALKEEMLTTLHNDISTLLFPSKKRALELNKGYKTMVKEQSFIYGRDANVKPMENVYREIEEEQETQIEEVVVLE